MKHMKYVYTLKNKCDLVSDKCDLKNNFKLKLTIFNNF